jgi:transcriptional regulator with XRE-family HTH domain
MNGDELRALRTAAGLTQQQLAGLIGLRWHNTVSRWERGTRHIAEPMAKLIRLVCDAQQKGEDSCRHIQRST